MAAHFITGTSDLIPASGSIKEIGLKPWWETIQSYCLYALFAIDVVVFYINGSFSSVTCTPFIDEAPSLSTPDANFVNSICYGQIDEIFRYSGRNVLIGCVVLYLLNAWWELVPVVKTRFVTVKNVDNLLHQRCLPESEIKRIVTTPLNSGGDQAEEMNDSKVVRDACRRLFLCDVQFSLFGIYVLRNIPSVVGVAVASGLAWTSYDESTKQGGSTFKCTLDSETATGLGITEFRCSNHLPIQLAGYFLAVFIILLAMGAMSSIGILASLIKWCSTTTTAKDSSEKGYLMKDYALVTLFSDHSTKVHRSTAAVMSLISDDLLGGMEKNIIKAIQRDDKDFLRLFYSLRKEGKTKVIEKAKTYVRKKNQQFATAEVEKFMGEFPELFENTRFEDHFGVETPVASGQAGGSQPPQPPNIGDQSNGSGEDPPVSSQAGETQAPQPPNIGDQSNGSGKDSPNSSQAGETQPSQPPNIGEQSNGSREDPPNSSQAGETQPSQPPNIGEQSNGSREDSPNSSQAGETQPSQPPNIGDQSNGTREDPPISSQAGGTQLSEPTNIGNQSNGSREDPPISSQAGENQPLQPPNIGNQSNGSDSTISSQSGMDDGSDLEHSSLLSFEDETC